MPPYEELHSMKPKGKEGEEKRGEKKRKRERKGGDGASHLELQTCLRHYQLIDKPISVASTFPFGGMSPGISTTQGVKKRFSLLNSSPS